MRKHTHTHTHTYIYIYIYIYIYTHIHINYGWGGHGDEFIPAKKMYPVIGKTVLCNTRTISEWNFVYTERYVIHIKMEYPV